MYSDYYFLTNNGVAFSTDGKSPERFHEIASEQVHEMQECFRQQSTMAAGALLPDFSNIDLVAEQACAMNCERPS